MKNKVIIKWHSIVLSLGAVIASVYLFSHPQILEYVPGYSWASFLYSNEFFGVYFLVFGTLKLLGIVFNLRRVRGVSLSFLNAGWALLAVTFFLLNRRGIENVTFIVAGMLFLIGFGEAIRGRFSK